MASTPVPVPTSRTTLPTIACLIYACVHVYIYIYIDITTLRMITNSHQCFHGCCMMNGWPQRGHKHSSILVLIHSRVYAAAWASSRHGMTIAHCSERLLHASACNHVRFKWFSPGRNFACLKKDAQKNWEVLTMDAGYTNETKI
jgi:hypothetical protein